ncbi:MAG: biotin--[acetyl-CoA-carboxylase] ligase [Anaerolineales bacterium]|jgi:BirA family biotin operon repressor/biotin-[acetyl-CoA-carboxylase] ligase
MDEQALRKILSDIPLGGLRTFEQVGSTNDTALAWAADGAPDLAMVYADEQKSGRGRGDRRWFTPPGAALAFSLINRPSTAEEQSIPLFSGLGAIAVCEALGLRGLHPEIKWPNDVLLDRRKVCGILAEAVWMGEKVDCIILGIGVNVNPGSVPSSEKLNFPATCVETVLGKSVDRLVLLRDILQALLYWRSLLTKDVFPAAWNKYLAFRGEQVEIHSQGVPARTGQVDGLERDGSLRLRSQDGQFFLMQFGEVQLRPVL